VAPIAIPIRRIQVLQINFALQIYRKETEKNPYALTSDQFVLFSDIAEILSTIHAKEMSCVELSDEECFELKRVDWVPNFVIVCRD
jgi:hypothetical protein